MKVLFVASGNSINGLTPVVKNQGDSLQKINVNLEYFPIQGKGLNSYLRHVFILRRKLKINNYDIIHAHYGLCGIVSHLARDKQKLIVSIMGDDINGAINNHGKYSLAGYILALLNKLFLTKYDFVIVKSSALASKIKFEINNEIIPNGVDLNLFYEVDKLEARKKIEIDSNTKLVIFASNPKRPEKNFKLAKESVGLLKNENILLMPVYCVSREELKFYYSAADLMLLTSIQEGSPNVIKEAMACNCPIVSTDVGDVKWIIGSTEGCYLTTFDPKEIAQKIIMAISFSEKVGRTTGRKRIIEIGLDSDTIAKRIINIYQTISNN